MMRPSASIVGDFAGLRDIEPAWTAATRRQPTPSPTVLPAWNYGMMARHAAGGAFRVLALRDGADIALGLPYLVEKTGGRTRLRATSEITPVLCPAPAPALFDRALDILTALHGPHALVLDHAETERAEVAGFIAAATARYGAVEIRRRDANVIVDLSAGWETVRARLSGNAREALRRSHARLRRLGLEARYRVCTGPDEMGAAFAELLAVDARSWKYLRGGAMALSANEHAQFAFAFQKFSEEGQARIFLLTLNGRAAAFILAIVIDDRAYMAIWSYDDAFSACSPGRLVMEKALSDLAAAGIRQVDFWGRADDFKTSWSRDVVERASITFHPDRAAFAVARGARRAAAPLLTLLDGPAERYRLRRDVSGWADRLSRPLAVALERRRKRRDADALTILQSDRRAADGIGCRPVTEIDKLHLPPGVDAVTGGWWTFERNGRLVGAVRLELWRRRTLHADRLWLANGETSLRLGCAQAVLDRFPAAETLLEPRAELALTSGGGLGAALFGARA